MFKNSWHLLCLLSMISFSVFSSEKISLSDDEISYLKAHKSFTLCADPHWPPFEKIERGIYSGISAEYFKIFSKRLGVKFNIQLTKTWQETLQKVNNGECDVLSLSLITPKRLEHIKLTQTLLKASLVLATKTNHHFISDFKELQGKKIAIVEGYAYQYTLKEEISNVIIVNVKTPEEGLDLVIKGEVIAYLDAFPAIAYLMQTQFSNQIAISARLDHPLKISSGVSLKHPLLLSALNKAIKSLSGSDKLNVFNKHFNIKYQNQNIFNSKRLLVLLLIIILFSLFIWYRYKIIKDHNYAMQAKIDIIDTNVLLILINKTSKIKYVSTAFSKQSGYSDADLKGVLVERLKFDQHKDRETEIKNVILDNGFWHGEIKIIKKGGGYFWSDVTIINSETIQKHYSGFHIIFKDISNEKKLEKLSQTDSLTKLNNRLLLDERFESEFLRVSRYQTHLSILIVDIDFFKLVNDEHGHHVGDQVLITFSNILKEMARKTDILGRWGGEEFLIICPETSIQGAFTLAEKIRKKVEEQEFTIVGRITCSIGVTQYKEADLAKDMFIRSDNALYQAKKEGRNKIVFYY